MCVLHSRFAVLSLLLLGMLVPSCEDPRVAYERDKGDLVAWRLQR